MFILKILQTIRLLSRNKIIQVILHNDEIILTFEQILEKLILKKHPLPPAEIIDNILIEIISIIKRYFSKEQNFSPRITSSNLIDHLIFLLTKENTIILKLLHMILLSLLEK